MNKKFIIANWKMNPKSFKEAAALFEAIKKGIKSSQRYQVVICPPTVWLAKFKSVSAVALGAQNCHWEAGGAYTGEVSANMLADLGATYVILGHSERRRYLGETDEIINLKIKAALRVKLKPILCIGEGAGEEMSQVIEHQLTHCLQDLILNQIKDLIIAYEPVWAISTENNARPCLPDQALSAALFIRKTLTKLYSRFTAENIPVLYGGSVSAANIGDYLKGVNLDGALVGGASLEAENFLKLVRAID